MRLLCGREMACEGRLRGKVGTAGYESFAEAPDAFRSAAEGEGHLECTAVYWWAGVLFVR